MDSGPLVQANNSVIRELQPTPNLDLGRLRAASLCRSTSAGIRHRGIDSRPAEAQVGRPRLPGDYLLRGCHRQPKMTPVYEAGGTIEIKKPDRQSELSKLATFSLDYYDPTEMETDIKILQSDLLALQVIQELNLDRRPEFARQARLHALFTRSCSRSAAKQIPREASAMVGSSKEVCESPSVPNTRIIRSPLPQRGSAEGCQMWSTR